jgi:hypothetical protein
MGYFCIKKSLWLQVITQFSDHLIFAATFHQICTSSIASPSGILQSNRSKHSAFMSLDSTTYTGKAHIAWTPAMKSQQKFSG